MSTPDALDMQQRFSGTKPVAAGHRFEVDRLERYLAEHLDAYSET